MKWESGNEKPARYWQFVWLELARLPPYPGAAPPHPRRQLRDNQVGWRALKVTERMLGGCLYIRIYRESILLRPRRKSPSCGCLIVNAAFWCRLPGKR